MLICVPLQLPKTSTNTRFCSKLFGIPILVAMDVWARWDRLSQKIRHRRYSCISSSYKETWKSHVQLLVLDDSAPNKPNSQKDPFPHPLLIIERMHSPLQHGPLIGEYTHSRLSSSYWEICVLLRTVKFVDLLGFKNASQHLLANVEEPLTELQRALNLPYCLSIEWPLFLLKRALESAVDRYKPNSRRKGSAAGDTGLDKDLKRGLPGTIDGLKVSALADTGAAQNFVSSNFAGARKLDVAGSPRSFRLGNSKLAHSLGTSKNRLDKMTK